MALPSGKEYATPSCLGQIDIGDYGEIEDCRGLTWRPLLSRVSSINMEKTDG